VLRGRERRGGVGGGEAEPGVGVHGGGLRLRGLGTQQQQPDPSLSLPSLQPHRVRRELSSSSSSAWRPILSCGGLLEPAQRAAVGCCPLPRLPCDARPPSSLFYRE
jgi:hypothetical protein